MIRIPFNERFHDKLRKREKTMTARTKAYGKAGDVFEVDGVGRFRLLSVVPCALRVIAEKFHKEEGCESPREFMDVWVEIHPGRGWTPNLVVKLHVFELLVAFPKQPEAAPA